jgi:hypothetical protein
MTLKRAPVTIFREHISQAPTMGDLWKLPQGALGRWGDHTLWFPADSREVYQIQEGGEIFRFRGDTEEELNTFLCDSNWFLVATPVLQPV